MNLPIIFSLIGSPEKKGISGGQKKRVSIGMELMKEPSLFFLDEPTRLVQNCIRVVVSFFCNGVCVILCNE